MSHRITAFTTLIPTPLTRRDITVIWPEMVQSSLLVQSTTFPTEAFNTVSVPVGGVNVELPTHVYRPGVWTFEVPDNVYTSVRAELVRAYYEQKMHDILLVLGDVTDAYPTSESIRGVLGSMADGMGSVSTLFSTAQVLHRAFIKEISDIQLSQGSGSESAVLWRVTVQYSYISKAVMRD